MREPILLRPGEDRRRSGKAGVRGTGSFPPGWFRIFFWSDVGRAETWSDSQPSVSGACTNFLCVLKRSGALRSERLEG